MKSELRKIAVNFGSEYVPGLSSVLVGVVRAATDLGWGVVGIRDGFDGLLFRDRYPDRGLVPLTPELVDHLGPGAGALIGTAARTDPFRVRAINSDNGVEEVDRSAALISTLRDEKIEAVVSAVGSRSLSVLFKLGKLGVRAVAIPMSVENDVTGTQLCFGFNSALAHAAGLIEGARHAAASARRTFVVEVLGEHAGWLALQSGIAALADAVLIPEIPFDLHQVAAALSGRSIDSGVVVVAAGAQASRMEEAPTTASSPATSGLWETMSPNANPRYGEGPRAIERSGAMAVTVARELQLLTDREAVPLALGHLVRGAAATVVDRQLGIGYGAAAVRAIARDQTGVLVSFQPPDIRLLPLAEAVNRYRTIPPESELQQIARAIGISLGN